MKKKWCKKAHICGVKKTHCLVLKRQIFRAKNCFKTTNFSGQKIVLKKQIFWCKNGKFSWKKLWLKKLIVGV